MSDTRLNLFELTDPNNFRCKYRLYAVDGLPKTEEYGHNIELLRTKISYEIYQPVTLVPYNGGHALAIPATAPKPELEQQLTPAVVTLIPKGEHDLSLDSVTPATANILLEFVNFFIKTPLRTNPALWSSHGRSFLWKQPVNYTDETRNIDVFEGFSYTIHLMEGKLYLSLDVTTRYVDRYFLTERLADSDSTSLKWKNFLYHFCRQIYEVQLIKVLDRSIGNHKFVDKDGVRHSIFDYTRKRCTPPVPEYIRTLDPSSPAIVYRNPGNRQERYGAAALCKRTFRTDDPAVRTLHARSIKKPDERFATIQEFLNQAFRNTRYGPFDISINKDPLHVLDRSFAVPDQVFGNGKILHVKHHSDDLGVPMDHLGRERIRLIGDQDVGIYVQSPFLPQYMVVPRTFPRSVHDDFKQQFIRRIQKYAAYPSNPATVLYDDREASSLRRQVQSIRDALKENEIERGYALVILPAHAHGDLHNYLKRELWPHIQFQCAMATKIASFYDVQGDRAQIRRPLEQRYQSYLQNISLGMLEANRKWPWVLGDSLHYDAYVGVDVKSHILGVSFVYQNGRQVIIRSERSQQKEKLLGKMMRTLIQKNVAEDIENYGLKIGSLVMHRDGRTYPEEVRGFEQGIGDLIGEGLVDRTICAGIVEIPKKSSKGLRLVFRDTAGRYNNPSVGSYCILNEREGLVCNTGYPFHMPGTVIPLHARIVHGDLGIKKILEDIFALSQLAWSAPDKSQRLPMTIKLIDDLLRSVAGTADDDEALYG